MKILDIYQKVKKEYNRYYLCNNLIEHTTKWYIMKEFEYVMEDIKKIEKSQWDFLNNNSVSYYF